MTLGKHIRSLREQKGISMKVLAEKVNVSQSMISQLERDLANPSVSLLMSIADELDVKVGMLFSEENVINTVVRKNERKRIVYKDGLMIHELLAPITNRKIEFIYNIYKPGGFGGLVSHEGEECALILQGTAELNLNGEIYILEEGDSFYHESSAPHSIRNIGDIDLIAVYAITPPSF